MMKTVGSGSKAYGVADQALVSGPEAQREARLRELHEKMMMGQHNGMDPMYQYGSAGSGGFGGYGGGGTPTLGFM
jgi:hypothetical protein